MYDVDRDGSDDVVVATGTALSNRSGSVGLSSQRLAKRLLIANGEIVFLNQSGLPAYGKTLKGSNYSIVFVSERISLIAHYSFVFQVPPLRVNKDWYEGIANSNNIAGEKEKSLARVE